ncbi:hypothetical protein ES703_63941 [subsurface metagenome]
MAFLVIVSVAEAFSGTGSGTAQDPYIITNVDQLQEMKDDLSAWYELGNDIDATATSGTDNEILLLIKLPPCHTMQFQNTN